MESQGCQGFLLWQSAYSEVIFQDVYWPEFRKIDFLRCLREYSQRERRFWSINYNVTYSCIKITL